MMNLKIWDYVMIALGAMNLLAWLIFYFKGRKHNAMFEVITEKEYPLKEIYGLGYAILETFKYKYKSREDRKLRQQLDVLYGDKYCEYYL